MEALSIMREHVLVRGWPRVDVCVEKGRPGTIPVDDVPDGKQLSSRNELCVDVYWGY